MIILVIILLIVAIPFLLNSRSTSSNDNGKNTKKVDIESYDEYVRMNPKENEKHFKR